ncbi:MAG: adenylate/guanylate cyclase domain-containing protein [bacterium]|nr:adenylate/guanylate cyclase domain-containing protein [bacterium]
MKLDVEQSIKGSLRGAVSQELFSNSLHFPLANILVELLHAGPALYLAKPDPWVLVFACLVQAYLMGLWRFQERTYVWAGNLIGVGIYTLYELGAEGFEEYIESPNHRVYITFSILIGLIQLSRQWAPGWLEKVLLLVENVVRTGIIMAMFWVIEVGKNPNHGLIIRFFDNEGHVFMTLILLLLGLLIGSANLSALTYQELLQRTAQQLRRFSEWLFGRELLGAVMKDQNRLALKRTERSILFMDIRGFTAWAEAKSPEAVVSMLNGYFELCESVWGQWEAIKVKHTADEIMAIFSDTSAAYNAALEARALVGPYLAQDGLAAGIGLHVGEVVEGLIGSKEVKVYDIIGDTANTTKRICDRAEAGEILLSEEMSRRITDFPTGAAARKIEVKGKSEPIPVVSLVG